MADRSLIPGRWHRDGRRPALAACTGSCNQGRAPCDCAAMPRPVLRPVLHPDLHRVTLTELDLELPHDAERVIPAPPRAPRTRPADPMQRRRLSRAGATAAAALIAFGLLCLWGSTRAHADPVAVVFVGRS
jgi:hypothetical protein